MTFKEFLLREAQIGLGNLAGSMDRVFGKHFSDMGHSYVSYTDFTQPPPEGYIGDPTWMTKAPAGDVTIPSVERTGRIIELRKNDNPIYIRMSDGTETTMTVDQFKRIEGEEPAIGKVMTVVLQRHPSDQSVTRSQVQRAIVHN